MLSLTVIIALASHISNAHLGCGTDHMKHKISKNMNIKPVQHTKKLEGRAQDSSSSTFSNIRIRIDTTQLEQDWAGFDKLSFYLDDVIPAAYEWIRKVFKVRPVDGNLTFDVCNEDRGSVWNPSVNNEGKCAQVDPDWQHCGNTGAVIPETMFDAEEVCASANGACDTTTYLQGSGLPDTDLVIYYTGNPDLDDTTRCTDVMGFATYCHSNARDRPIAGAVNLCRSTIEQYAYTWEESITVIIHETFHSLGFISSAFKRFRNSDDSLRDDVYKVVTKRGMKRAVITLPTVVEKAKSFFNCETMDGIELEEYSNSEGGPLFGNLSSHWDLRILNNDVMVSYPPGAPVYGLFTLALFADSGWYEIDWDYAQEAPFGKNAGCPWYDDKCITSDGAINDVFCTEDVESSCNVGQIGIYRCTVDEYANAFPDYYRYFEDATFGGNDHFSDFCPLFKLLSNGECRLWGDNNNGTIPPYIDEVGGLISGTSKCLRVHGSKNGEKQICYPLHCIKNDAGDYIGSRITHHRNYKLTTFDVITCWSDEDGEGKTFGFDYNPDLNYGFRTIYCPSFKDICYDSNPWMCNGHGTIVDGSCVCSPGYFGRDCTIEYTKENRAKYDDTDSVSVYDDVVCGGADWNYNDSHANVGVLNIEITGINMNLYEEEYFKDALKHFVAVVTMIPTCDVDVREYEYDVLDDTRITASVYYYTSLVAWDDLDDAEIQTAFGYLFESVSYSGFSVTQNKTAEGDHDDNIDIAVTNQFWRFLYVVFLIEIWAFLL